ncbi:MAG: signal peptidase II, partial [Ruminococcus sp.]|nr:signal peptidase II [Ruminococcus sp.]
MAVFLVIMIGVLVTADQLVKNWAVDVLQPVGSMDFIHFGDFKIIDLTYLENDGAIFGSMSG